jgi:hypothetical protein
MRLKEVKELPPEVEQVTKILDDRRKREPWEQKLTPDLNLCRTEVCGWGTMILLRKRPGYRPYRWSVPQFVIHPYCPVHGDKRRKRA